MSKAVLFDVDDTLVDLQYARRQGLRAVQEILPELKRVPMTKLELAHDDELTANYQRTIDNSLSDEEARLEHMYGICRRFGLDTNKVQDAADVYVREQQANSRLVPGVEELFNVLRGRIKLGVVTNGRSDHQRDKLEFFELLPLDTVVISAEVGAVKPDPSIFRHAIAELGVQKVTMIGDSWEHDVLGAISSGIDAIWLNRYRRACPDPTLAIEIDGFEPIEKVLGALKISTR